MSGQANARVPRAPLAGHVVEIELTYSESLVEAELSDRDLKSAETNTSQPIREDGARRRIPRCISARVQPSQRQPATADPQLLVDEVLERWSQLQRGNSTGR